VMVGLYWGFSSSMTYYPISGKVTLDGRPAVGVKVILQATDDRLDGELLTDAEGTYHFATPQLAGGAPAGTQYRIRVVPARDFLVRLKQGSPEQLDEVLASVPAGTTIREGSRDGQRVFVLGTGPDPPKVAVDPDTPVAVWHASAVPKRYQSFQNSGLGCVVRAGENRVDLPLKTPGA
jgi:hypothetical protein